jgi:transcription initiation factor IIE alpha subunit
MSSVTTTTGSSKFTTLNPSISLPRQSNTPNNSSTKNGGVSSANDEARSAYDISDFDSALKTLIRRVMRTFYEIPKSLVIEYIYHHGQIKQQDLAERLQLDSKQVLSFIQEFKRDKFITEDIRMEKNNGATGRRHQDQYYYKINIPTFINVVEYRLIHMEAHVENLERQQTYKQSNYKCGTCAKEYTELDIGKLYDTDRVALVCYFCGELVHEDIEAKEESNTSNGQVANMSLFNEQLESLFQLLKHIRHIMINDQHLKASIEQGNGHTLLNNQNFLPTDNLSGNQARSHASNMFDRTSHINHDVEIIIEKDDDDYYSTTDIDDTNNVDSIISSSRGSGKPGKKSSKPGRSVAKVAIQPVSTKMALASKKTSYEPKPTPHWFTRSTIYTDHDEEYRLNHSLSQSNMNSLSQSRQLANQKAVNSATISGIKQILLVYESRRKNGDPLTTIEDSLSPPTPVQMGKISNSQSSASLSQFNTINSTNHVMDDDDQGVSLFHLINDESVHHMDIDKND